MSKFLSTKPLCDKCMGELVINELIVDIANCNFTLFCECIVCGEEQIMLLQLADFIELNQLLGGINGEAPQA
jgi:hypothetical protein